MAHLYASTNKVTIDPGKGLSPAWCKSWTKDDLFLENSVLFIYENMFKDVVCNIAAILYQPHCV